MAIYTLRIFWTKNEDTQPHRRYIEYCLDIPTCKQNLDLVEQAILDTPEYLFGEEKTIEIWAKGTHLSIDDIKASKLLQEEVATLEAVELANTNLERYKTTLEKMAKLHKKKHPYIISVYAHNIWHIIDSEHTTVNFVNGHFRAEGFPTLYCNEIEDIKIAEKPRQSCAVGPGGL